MKNIVLQPSFYDKFECIGGACKNDCCHGWEIDFTKEEFKNIKRKMKTDEFKEIFQDAFDVQKENNKYIIKLDEKGNCKFLDECGLCRIYKEVGPENMSKTCKVFPRFCTHNVDRYECFLSVGCEEVIRLLLEEKDGLMLEVIEKELTDIEKKNTSSEIDNARLAREPMLCHLTDLKILMLGVLQNREYTFGERMLVLGLAMKKVDEMGQKGEFIKIPDYIQDFVKDFNNIENKEIYNKMFENVNRNGNLRALQAICHYFLADFGYFSDVRRKVKDRIELNPVAVMENMKITKTNIKYNIEKYQQAMKDFEEFIKGKEYWIENVMIEGFLANEFPFRVKGGIWQNYCIMVMIYCTILFILTCCIEKNSTKEDFIYYTSIIARRMFHNKTDMEVMEEYLKQTESNTLAHMAMLVL